jgi:hypothetical protein
MEVAIYVALFLIANGILLNGIITSRKPQTEGCLEGCFRDMLNVAGQIGFLVFLNMMIIYPGIGSSYYDYFYLVLASRALFPCLIIGALGLFWHVIDNVDKTSVVKLRLLRTSFWLLWITAMLALAWHTSYLSVHVRGLIEGPVQAHGTVNNIIDVSRDFDEITIDETTYKKAVMFWQLQKGERINYVHDPMAQYAFPADQIGLSSLAILCLVLALPLNLMSLLISLFGYIGLFQVYKKRSAEPTD